MPDCIVVGGGVIGLLTARELHKRDVDVLLVERGELGGESSWAGGGIVSPLYPWLYSNAVNELAEASKSIYPDLIKELFDETGIDSELIQSGLLVVADEDNSQALNWSAEWSVDLSEVNRDEMEKIEPELNSAFNKGLWMPDVMQVRNPKLISALKRSFDVSGIPYRDRSTVDEIIIHNNEVSGVQIGDEKILAGKVVLATGAWSSDLAYKTLDIEPIKGQMIMYRGSPDMVKRIVLSGGHYVIPRADGKILAGSTLEKKGFDKSLSEDAMSELNQAAIELVPVLEKMSIERHWAGLRPGTQYGIPYICEHDAIANLFINAGHYRNGIVLGPASAKMMAELVTGKEQLVENSLYKMEALH